jgi:hypothetical protein
VKYQAKQLNKLEQVLPANEPVELLVFILFINLNTLTGLVSFNNQKRLRFWRFYFYIVNLTK